MRVLYIVLEQNPSKQGLKLKPFLNFSGLELRFRAKSIKTRIETLGLPELGIPVLRVLEQNPSKQGLKHYCDFPTVLFPSVLEQNPSKQGLKLTTQWTQFDMQFSFRAKSIKTRIETLLLSSTKLLSLLF